MRLLKLYIFFLLFISNLNSFSQQVDKREYKMNRKTFLLKYAQEDTTLAEAINLYFDKRATGINKIVAFPVGLATTLVCSAIYFGTNHSQTKSLSSYGIVFGGVTTLVGIPLGINGLKILKKYKRKDLYLAILQIKSGQMTSKDFYNKIHENE
jgi:hypothetical protein